MDTTTIIGDAIRTFKSTIYDIDAKELHSLSVQDVIECARTIEREREEQHRLCNLRRVESLLKELQRLAEAGRKLPQSPCPEYYIWGPVKLALEVANEDDGALEAILGGYARLTSSLRFLEQIVAAPHLVGASHGVIAYTISDVLEFHGRIYQALRRGGWRMLFTISWAELAPVFDCIVKRLEHSCSLVDRVGTDRSHTFGEINVSGNATAQLGDQFFEIEHATFAPTEDFSAARDFREKVLEDLRVRQKLRVEHQLLECIEWLDLQSQDRDQANLFSHCRDAREEATCGWILSHPRIKSWLNPDSKNIFLWLKGKPGKTTLAIHVIERAKLPAGSLVLYYLCSRENQPTHDILNTLLGTLAAQIIRSKRHLVPYVFETYVKNAEQPALKLPILLRQLLSCLPTTYIVIDGLNECDSVTQSRIINKLDSIIATRRNDTTAGPEVRILISSQEAKGIPHKLSKQPFISLTEEHAAVSHDIKVYTVNTINSLEDRFDQKVVGEIASMIMTKANGMFLWVKLVLLTLLEQESLFEIKTTLDRLPTGLAGIYKVLLKKLNNLADIQQRPRIRMIFYWMTFASRPMKAWEICDALVIGGSNLALVKDHTMLHSRILDICKPLIEVHKDQTVSFVHFSVKDYLLNIESGPFVIQNDALTHITSTCLKYLFTCEDFFSAKQSRETYRQIVLQLHSLFPYVAETWRDHFNTLATNLSAPSNESEILLSSLLADSSESKDHCTNLPSSQQHHHPTTPQNAAHISTDREVVMRSILQDLRDRSAGVERGGRPMSSSENCHDRVRQAFMCFQVQFEKLLMGQCPHSPSELGVSQVDLDLLRKRYATAVFRCRWSQCRHSSLGFAHVEERARHERSHTNQFCCPELGCAFQSNGFQTRAALRHHIHRYHESQEDIAVPRLHLGRGEATGSSSSRSGEGEDARYPGQDQKKEVRQPNSRDTVQMPQQAWMQQAQPKIDTAAQNGPMKLKSTRQDEIAEDALIRESDDSPLPAPMRKQLGQVFPGRNTAGLTTWRQLRELATDVNDPRIPPAKIRAMQLQYVRRLRQLRATRVNEQHATAAQARKNNPNWAPLRDYQIHILLEQQQPKTPASDTRSQQDQMWCCCTCRRVPVITLHRTKCPYPDCLHEYCSRCEKTTNEERSSIRHALASPDINEVLQSSAKVQDVVRAPINQAQQHVTPSSPSQRSSLQTEPDTAITDQRDSYLEGQSQQQTLERQQTEQRQHSGVRELNLPRNLSLLHSFPHFFPVPCVGFSPDGRHIATAGPLNLQIFELQTGLKVSDLVEFGQAMYVQSLCYSPDGAYLAIVDIMAQIRIWDTESCQVRRRISTHGSGIISLVYTQGDCIVAACGSHGVQVWSVESGAMVRTFEAGSYLACCAVSPDRQYVAALSSLSNLIFLWHYASGQLIARHPASSYHMSSINEVAFSPDSSRLATCGIDGRVKIWEIDAMDSQQPGVTHYACVNTLGGVDTLWDHKDSVTSVCFSHKGRRLISGSSDKSIRLWGLKSFATPDLLATVECKDSVTCVAFSEAGNFFASVSADGLVQIWRYNEPDPI